MWATTIVDTALSLILIGLLPALIAFKKRRNFLLFWLFGACAPPIALVYAIFMSTKARCPACRESIWYDATICPYCRTPVQPAPTLSASG